MDFIGRRRPSHELPVWVDPAQEVFFLTICARDRERSPLLPVAEDLLAALRDVQTRELWWLHLGVVMPDHVHFLVRISPDVSLATTVRNWKRWTAAKLRVSWQRSFFEHRLRTNESLREKADYILENPVRAKLVTNWLEWPHVWHSSELMTLNR